MRQKEFRGCLVSVDCGEEGLYQGEMDEVVNDKDVILKRASKDGVPIGRNVVSLPSSKIQDIRVYKYKDGESPWATLEEIANLRGCLAAVEYSDGEFYQGQVRSIDSRGGQLTLEGATQDGIPVGESQLVTLDANKMKDVKVYKLTPAAETSPPRPAAAASFAAVHQLDTSDGGGHLVPGMGQFLGRYGINSGGERFSPNKVVHGRERPRTSPLGPSGIPSVDRTNGYISSRPGGGVLEEPLDLNLLAEDFDFQSANAGLPLFDKDES